MPAYRLTVRPRMDRVVTGANFILGSVISGPAFKGAGQLATQVTYDSWVMSRGMVQERRPSEKVPGFVDAAPENG